MSSLATPSAQVSLSDAAGFRGTYVALTLVQGLTMISYRQLAGSRLTFAAATIGMLFCMGGNFAMFPAQHRNRQPCGLQFPAGTVNDVPGFVGGIIQHLHLKTIPRIIKLQCRAQQTGNHFTLIVNRQLNCHKWEIVIVLSRRQPGVNFLLLIPAMLPLPSLSYALHASAMSFS